MVGHRGQRANEFLALPCIDLHVLHPWGPGTANARNVSSLGVLRPATPAGLIAQRSANDRAPVDDGIPQHALIAAIEVAMQRIEVERDDVTRTRAQIQDGGTSDEAFSSPRLTAHDQRPAYPLAPPKHHAAGIERAVETGRAVRHAQPAARNGIDRKVLAEHMGARGIAVRDPITRSRT